MKTFLVVFLGVFCWAESDSFSGDLLTNQHPGLAFPDKHPCDVPPFPEKCTEDEFCLLNVTGLAFCSQFEDLIRVHHYDRICRQLTIRGKTVKDCRCRSRCYDRGKKSEIVCGTNQCSYPTACHLYQHACETGKRIHIKKTKTCNIENSPDDCPFYAQIDPPPPSNVSVSLNASEIVSWVIKVTPYVSDWIDWEQVNRVIDAFEIRKNAPDEAYSSLFCSLKVLDAFDVIDVSREPLYADYVREKCDYSFLPMNCLSSDRFSAIADALLTLSEFNFLTFQEQSRSRKKIFTGQVFLPCKVKNTQKVRWFHNGTELMDGVKYKILTNGLLIQNVRAIDAREYTCEASGSFGEKTIATTYVKANYSSSSLSLPPYISQPSPYLLNHTVWCGKYPALRFRKVNALNVTFVNYTTPYLELTDASLSNVTFINCTIDTLVLSGVTAKHIAYINVTLKNATYSNVLMINSSVTNMTRINATAFNMGYINVTLVNCTSINLMSINETNFNLTMVNYTGINITRHNLTMTNASIINSIMTNFTEVNVTRFNVCYVNATTHNWTSTNVLSINETNVNVTHHSYTAVNVTLHRLSVVNVANFLSTKISTSIIDSYLSNFSLINGTSFNFSIVNSSSQHLRLHNESSNLFSLIGSRFFNLTVFNSAFRKMIVANSKFIFTSVESSNLLSLSLSNVRCRSGGFFKSRISLSFLNNVAHCICVFEDNALFFEKPRSNGTTMIVDLLEKPHLVLQEVEKECTLFLEVVSLSICGDRVRFFLPGPKCC